MDSELNDTELSSLLAAGDSAAFVAIYEKYVADLFRYARKNIQRKEDCEEIIQEVFTSLWERRESLRILSLKYYLINAVRYKVIRHIQHNKVKSKYAEHYRLFEMVYDSMEKEEYSPELIHTRLLQAVEALPERCRVAIKLRLLENLGNADIATRMNISINTVEVYMHKAYSHFRTIYHKIYNTQ